MPSGEISGSFLGLRGENCKFTKIEGVERLGTKNGIDLVHIAEGLHGQLSKFKELIDDLSDRLDALEAGGVVTTPATEAVREVVTVANEDLEDLEERVRVLESAPKVRHGRDGRDGAPGVDGRDAKEFRLRDIIDIDVSDIQNRSMLEWSTDRKKWVVSNIED